MAYTVLRAGTILVFLSIVIVSEVSLFAKLVLFFIGMLIAFLFNNSLLTKESISKQAKIALYSSMAVIAFFYIMAFFLAESASVVSFFRMIPFLWVMRFLYSYFLGIFFMFYRSHYLSIS